MRDQGIYVKVFLIVQVYVVCKLPKKQSLQKNILKNQKFIAGIGNAYSDEILFHAQISPLRTTSTLVPKEIERIFQSIKTVLTHAIEKISENIGEDIHKQNRDFFAVHGKGGMNCSKCAHPITELKPDGKITNYCRICQH